MKLIIPAVIAIVLLPMRIVLKEAIPKAIQRDQIYKVLRPSQQKTRADLMSGLIYLFGCIAVYAVYISFYR